MKKLDKLIELAQSLSIPTKEHKENGVHISEKGYCFSCGGTCKYRKKGNVDPISKDIEVINLNEPYNGFKDVPSNLLERLATLG